MDDLFGEDDGEKLSACLFRDTFSNGHKMLFAVGVELRLKAFLWNGFRWASFLPGGLRVPGCLTLTVRID